MFLLEVITLWQALAALIQQTGTDYDEHAVGTGACNATSARKREAITRCLQLAMWDSAAAVLDELGKPELCMNMKPHRVMYELTTKMQKEPAVDGDVFGNELPYLTSFLTSSTRRAALTQLKSWETTQGLDLISRASWQLTRLQGGKLASKGEIWAMALGPNAGWVEDYAIALSFGIESTSGVKPTTNRNAE